MYILSLDTTGPFSSCAILNIDTGKVISFEKSERNMSHLSDLIPMIERTIDRAGISKKDISYIAPSMGPGSFTGIRIGVATGRALAQSLGIKCIPVGTLDSFRFKELPKEADKYAIRCGIINARRGQVYGIVEAHMMGGAYMLTDVLEVIIEDAVVNGEEIVFYGDGIDAYRDRITEVLDSAKARYIFADEKDRYQDAASVAKLAYLKLKDNEIYDVQDMLPDYMREAEAEQKLRAGELPICHGPKQE